MLRRSGVLVVMAMLAASTLWAAARIAVGDVVELRRNTRMSVAGQRKPVQVTKGSRAVVQKVGARKIRVELQGSGASGWLPRRLLRRVVARTAPPPPPPPPPPSPPPPPPSPVDGGGSGGSSASVTKATPLSGATPKKASAQEGAPSEPATARSIAVYSLSGSPEQQRLRDVVTHAVVAELRKLNDVQVIGVDEIADMLDHEQNRQLLGCDDEGCATEIANALGVDEIVTGSLTRVGQRSVINLRRIDVVAGTVTKTFDLRMEPRGGEEYLAVVGDAVETLYSEQTLRPGQRRGVSEVVARALNAPPLSPWAFWATAAAGLGLAVTTAGATAMALWAASVHNRFAAGSVAPGEPITDVDLARRRQLAEAWDIARWSLIGGTVVVLVAAGFEAVLTDWQGAGGADPIALLDQDHAAQAPPDSSGH